MDLLTEMSSLLLLSSIYLNISTCVQPRGEWCVCIFSMYFMHCNQLNHTHCYESVEILPFALCEPEKNLGQQKRAAVRH